MSVIEMLLVYVGIPAAVLTCICTAVLAPGLSRRPRYRAGEPWGFEPVWYCPHPAALEPDLQLLVRASDRPALAGTSRPALTARSTATSTATSTGDPAGASAVDAEDELPTATARGGAHGEW